jgi:hypothetical protein
MMNGPVAERTKNMCKTITLILIPLSTERAAIIVSS